MKSAHRRTRSRLWPLAASVALDNAATRVSTHLKQQRVGPYRRPILVHRAVFALRPLQCASAFRNDDNHHPVTSLTPDNGTGYPASHRSLHRIAQPA